MGFVALVLLGDLSFPDMCWEYHTATTRKSEKFLKDSENNFQSQVLSEPAGKGALLDLFFEKRDSLLRKMIVGACLGHSDHEIVEFNGFCVRGGKDQ